MKVKHNVATDNTETEGVRDDNAQARHAIMVVLCRTCAHIWDEHRSV